MRRAIFAVTATVAGLVALLSFKTHSAERTGALAAPAASLPPGERAIAGNVADTGHGPVQVQLVVAASKIVKVNILEQPIGEALSAQSARIDAVSGATCTSGGYVKSLQSALDNGA